MAKSHPAVQVGFERTFDALTSTQHKSRFIASDSIGSWIVWTLLGRSPEAEDERKLVRAIGVSVGHIFFLGGAINTFRCSIYTFWFIRPRETLRDSSTSPRWDQELAGWPFMSDDGGRALFRSATKGGNGVY